MGALLDTFHAKRELIDRFGWDERLAAAVLTVAASDEIGEFTHAGLIITGDDDAQAFRMRESGAADVATPAVTWPVAVTDMYGRDLTAEPYEDQVGLRLYGDVLAYTGTMSRCLDRDAARTLAAALLAYADSSE